MGGAEEVRDPLGRSRQGLTASPLGAGTPRRAKASPQVHPGLCSSGTKSRTQWPHRVWGPGLGGGRRGVPPEGMVSRSE